MWVSFWYILVFKNFLGENVLFGAHSTQGHEATTTMHVIHFFILFFIGKIKGLVNHGPSQDLWQVDPSFLTTSPLLRCLLFTASIDFLKNLRLFVIHIFLKRNKKLPKYVLSAKCQKQSSRGVLLKRHS